MIGLLKKGNKYEYKKNDTLYIIFKYGFFTRMGRKNNDMWWRKTS